MRVARYRYNGTITYGIASGDDDPVVNAIDGDPFGDYAIAHDAVSLEHVELLVPVAPSKVVGFGRNFAPADRADDEEPSFFFKPPTSLTPTNSPIRLPKQARGGALYEVELAVVIGRECRDVAADAFADVVFGYTIANDVTGLDLDGVPAGHYPVKAKAYDTFCPLGPWIQTELDPLTTRLGCVVNGSARQEASTADLLTSVPDLIAIASSVMTLLPGDVILTGTPPGLAPLTGGEDVDAWIDGIGHLRNSVVAA